MVNNIITIDGVDFPVRVVSLDETTDFVDKFADRTETWDLLRQLAGIFFNYTLVLGKNQDTAVMNALWAKIHEFTEYHTVTLPHDEGLQTYTAYITTTGRSLLKRKNGTNYWSGPTIKFIAKAPQITE